MKAIFGILALAFFAGDALAESYACRVLYPEPTRLVDVLIEVDGKKADITLPHHTYTGEETDHYIAGQMQSRRALSSLVWYKEQLPELADDAEFQGMVSLAEAARASVVTADSINVGTCDDGCIATLMNHKDENGALLATTVMVGWGAMGTCQKK